MIFLNIKFSALVIFSVPIKINLYSITVIQNSILQYNRSVQHQIVLKKNHGYQRFISRPHRIQPPVKRKYHIVITQVCAIVQCLLYHYNKVTNYHTKIIYIKVINHNNQIILTSGVNAGKYVKCKIFSNIILYNSLCTRI